MSESRPRRAAEPSNPSPAARLASSCWAHDANGRARCGIAGRERLRPRTQRRRRTREPEVPPSVRCARPRRRRDRRCGAAAREGDATAPLPPCSRSMPSGGRARASDMMRSRRPGGGAACARGRRQETAATSRSSRTSAAHMSHVARCASNAARSAHPARQARTRRCAPARRVQFARSCARLQHRPKRLAKPLHSSAHSRLHGAQRLGELARRSRSATGRRNTPARSRDAEAPGGPRAIAARSRSCRTARHPGRALRSVGASTSVSPSSVTTAASSRTRARRRRDRTRSSARVRTMVATHAATLPRDASKRRGGSPDLRERVGHDFLGVRMLADDRHASEYAMPPNRSYSSPRARSSPLAARATRAESGD